MESEINGVKVTFRDQFPARWGWDLLKAVRRIDRIRRERINEVLGRNATDEELNAESPAEDVQAALAKVQWLNVIQENLTFEDAVKFVRGAVASWDFPGDLARADCCDTLNTVHEFMPLVTSAVLLYYRNQDAAKLQGEAESGSTSPSEG